MSTRCQIEFKESVWKGKRLARSDRRTIYQHADGYPDGEHGVVRTMQRFFEWEQAYRGFDIEYSPANYLYWVKADFMRDWTERNGDTDHNTLLEENLRLGYGVCKNDEFHGDIQFFYQVEMRRTIKEDVYRSQLLLRPYAVTRSGDGSPTTRKDFQPLEPVVLQNHEQRRTT